MKNHFKIALYFFALFASIGAKASLPQSDDSLLIVHQKQDSINFVANLVGLRDLWWVQNAAANKYLLRPPANRDVNNVPQFTDEDYIARIKNINSVIKLCYNNQVRGCINLYCYQKRDLVEFMLGFSEYYFPIFEQIFDKEGVPQELKYLALIESALNPRATSKAGAVGLWQFMYSTGKIYGLKINSFVDERRDPIKATKAAARFLRDLYGMFNDWNLALAAYNCGPGNVKKAIKRAGGKTDYWDIYSYLPAETRGYVPAYIAATYVMNYHEMHNLYPREISIPTTVDTIMVRERLHLQQVADVLQIPIELIEDMNPQYRLNIVPFDDKSNPLYLPGEFGERFIELQDSIYAYKDSVFFDPAYMYKQPARFAYNDGGSSSHHKRTVSEHSSSSSSSSGTGKTRHVVRRGDNLSKIADKYGVTVAELREWNKMRNSVVMVGQSLIIKKLNNTKSTEESEESTNSDKTVSNREESKPEKQVERASEDKKEVASEKSVKTTKKNEKTTKEKAEVVEKEANKKSESQESKSKKVAEKNTAKQTEKETEIAQSKENIIFYKVRSGDTLWSITQKYPGVTQKEILKLNGLKNANELMAGMKLKIKVKS